MELASLLDVLISISEYPICSAIEFLQYHDFQKKIKFYYLEDISYKPIELMGAENIVNNTLYEINSDYPLITKVLTELPPHIMNIICNIYFDPIQLNELDFISKLDFDFTDKKRIADLAMHDYTIEGRLIDKKLSNLALQFGLVDKKLKPIQLPIDEVKNLVTHFNHQFVIKNNNLELVNQDIFMAAGSNLTFINSEPKINDRPQRIVELDRELAQIKDQPIKFKAKILNHSVDDEPIHHKTINSMATLVATLLKLASYDKQDLENPHGNINKEIIAKAEGLGLTLGKDFIAKWLKKADEVL
ncbi:hypothetical protein CXF60_05695 [Psychrobacter sp. 4Bb]|nr:hypothetical protein [Psychrobacter nivimaris]PKH81357.1 hypothetical protein CXF60_05695 [Psychrobacter sp. 4Bb]